MGQPIQNIPGRKEWFGLSSPIGVIGAFAALVEVALILGSIFVEGNYRWAMLGFAFLAFTYIMTWFFYILSQKPWVLYPPKEYGGETGVLTYVGAMRSPATEGGKGELQVTAVSISNSATGESSIGLATTDRGSTTDLMIYMGPVAPNSLGLPIGFERFFSVTEFLTYVGNTFLPSVETEDETENKRRHDMNYGTSWLLRNLESQADIVDIGTRWSYRQTGGLSDLRRLRDTCLKPGMRLEVIRLKGDSLPISELLADDERIFREEPPALENGSTK